MNSKRVLACMALWLGSVGGEAAAADKTNELFVDRQEIDDYNGFIYTPIVSRFNAGDVKFKFTVPIVRFASAASAGFYTDDALTIGRTAGLMNYAELGDIALKASKSIWRSKRTGLNLTAGAKMEFATGDVSKDIGSGRTEAILLLDVSQPIRSFELLAGMSYSARHSFTEDPALNGLSGYVGVAYNLTPRTYLDATYEYAQASELGDPAERKLTLALNHGSGSSWTLRSYASVTREGLDRERELGLSLIKSW